MRKTIVLLFDMQNHYISKQNNTKTKDDTFKQSYTRAVILLYFHIFRGNHPPKLILRFLNSEETPYYDHDQNASQTIIVYRY